MRRAVVGPAATPAWQVEQGPIATVWSWLEQHQELLGWLAIASIGSLVLCAVLLPVIVVRLPGDYFATSRPAAALPRTLGGWTWHIVKNLLGVVFLLVGLALLLLPGQGLLTMLIGLLLLDLPKKRAIERRLLARPRILALLDALRRRHGRPPFRLD